MYYLLETGVFNSNKIVTVLDSSDLVCEQISVKDLMGLIEDNGKKSGRKPEYNYFWDKVYGCTVFTSKWGHSVLKVKEILKDAVDTASGVWVANNIQVQSLNIFFSDINIRVCWENDLINALRVFDFDITAIKIGGVVAIRYKYGMKYLCLDIELVQKSTECKHIVEMVYAISKGILIKLRLDGNIFWNGSITEKTIAKCKLLNNTERDIGKLTELYKLFIERK